MQRRTPIVTFIDERLVEARAERAKLEAARAALTGKRRVGRPRAAVRAVRPGTPRHRVPLPELDAALRSRRGGL